MTSFRRTVRLSVLNGMTGTSPAAAMDRQRAWCLPALDVKDCWFGKRVECWTDDEMALVIDAAAARHLTITSLSSSIGCADIAAGEAAYRETLIDLAQLLRHVERVRPERVRLVAPSLHGRQTMDNTTTVVQQQYPWLWPILRDMVDQLAALGATVVFENESFDTLFGHPTEVLDFFAVLDRPQARMIWDVGNWWHFGCARFPTIADAQQLLPVIGVVHLKGGIAERGTTTLRWAGPLSATTWDVEGIVQTLLAGGVTELCLNPPHGAYRTSVVHDYRADLDFLRITFPEIA